MTARNNKAVSCFLEMRFANQSTEEYTSERFRLIMASIKYITDKKAKKSLQDRFRYRKNNDFNGYFMTFSERQATALTESLLILKQKRKEQLDFITPVEQKNSFFNVNKMSIYKHSAIINRRNNELSIIDKLLNQLKRVITNRQQEKALLNKIKPCYSVVERLPAGEVERIKKYWLKYL